MKHRKLMVVSTLVTIGIIGAVAGLALYTNYSVKASAPSLPEALNSLPSDCQFLFGINVQKFVSSSAYAKFRQRQSQQIGNDLAAFIDKTGVDPARDIAYLVAAGRPGEKAKGEGVVIVTGRFNQSAITAYIRSKSTPIEMKYGGALVLMIPDPKNDAVERGVVFLDGGEIAMGDLESLKAVLDVGGKADKSILSNPAIAPLISSISPDEMFWFAGDAAGVLAKAPVSNPLGANISSIRNVVGILNITDAVTGKITVTAINAESATKLADTVRGVVAFGQLAGDQNPDLKMLLGGLAISQTSTQVSVALNFPTALLEKLEQARKTPRQTITN